MNWRAVFYIIIVCSCVSLGAFGGLRVAEKEKEVDDHKNQVVGGILGGFIGLLFGVAFAYLAHKLRPSDKVNQTSRIFNDEESRKLLSEYVPSY